MFVLDRSQRARIQKFPRIVAAVVSLALVATALEARQPAVAALADDPKQAVATVVSRPDVVSAAVTARAQGTRVEVESMRTETSSTWSNPDGTMTTDAHAAPIRFKGTTGAWRDIDLTLQQGIDGTVAPRGHQYDLKLGKRNSATGQVFASADSGAGREVEWLAPWKLPEPTLDGTKATYADVQPGVDLVLDARRNGFENDFIVKQRPAVAPVWRIPLRTKGLTPRQLGDGTIEFVDAKNVVQSRIPVGYMWDSAPNGQQNRVTVKVTVEQVSAGRATLVIEPGEWLMDSSRIFPITVDPTYVTGTTKAVFDTWIRSGVTTDQSASTDLQVGYDGSFWARSFLNFTTATFAGKDIISANLSLWQHSSLSCTPTSMTVRGAEAATTAARWTDQPAMGSSYGSVSSAKGYSASCPGGRITVPMTGLAQAWSTATYPTGGMALVATNEQDATTYKKFYSTVAIADPYITMTWNRAPAVPAIPTFVSAVAYAPPSGSSALYSPYLNPWVSTKASDADGNTVKYVFEFHTSPEGPGSLKATCTSATYASGSTAGCQPSVNLPEDTAIFVKAKANDGHKDSAWSGWSPVRVGSLQPTGPVISCPSPYVINSWQDNEPTSDVVCTVTATGTGFNAPGYLRLTVDGKPVATNFIGGAAGQVKITPSSDPALAKTTVTFRKDTPGLHRITAQAESPAGRLSGSASHSFGWGGSGITSPTADPRVTSTDTIKIEASGPPKGQSALPTARVRWRVSGYGGSAYDTVGWNEDGTELPVTDNGTAGVSVSTSWNTKNAVTDAHLDSDPSTPQVEPTTLNDRVPALLDIQVCFTYASSTQCSWSQNPGTTVQRVPHAFGNGFPTAEAGPGQVALWTGEFNTDTTDISVPGYTGSLSISRSHATYAGPANTVNGVFGPGWVAHFDGADAGAAGLEVVDSTRVDGTIALVDGDGSALVYESPTGQRRTTAAYTAGTWVPTDEETELDGSRLTVTGAGVSTTISYIEDDGTVTTWTPAAAPAATSDTLFRAAGVAEPGVASKTTYSYDGSGRITRILAPAPPGVTCPADGTLNPGCRALRFVYATINSQVRLNEAWLDIYNPDKTGGAGMDSIKVASYTYEQTGEIRLTKVTDPRSNLSTEYGYNAANHLTSVKPAGQVPFQLNYVSVDQREKLDTVKRDRPAGDPAGGTATLAKFVYAPDVPLSGTGLPDLSATSVARWNQKTAPTNGFAVFGPDHELTGIPGSGDWQYADLQYTDASGYTVNTANYGAGDWQYTATDYNDQGNTVRELDERALRLVIDNQLPSGATVDQLASLTIYNNDVLGADQITVVTPAGTLVTDTYGPARFAALKDGSVKWVRTHTHTTFDENAPNAGINPDTTLPYRLATKETSWAQDPGTGADLEMTAQSLTNYGPPVDGDADGWALSQAGKTATDVNLNGVIDTATDIIKLTRYDAEGRAVETRQPESNGSDAGTTKTVYYTAAANTPVACGGKPEWAGLVCQTGPAASPSGGTGTLPTTTTSGFTYMLAPKTVVETSGAVTRTNTTTYLLDGRAASTKTTVTGLAGSTPNTEKVTTYDPATGQPTVVTAKNADGSTAGTITTGYDTWGRPTTYQPSGEQVTTTVYDAAGRTATVTDANGSTTYTYDATDAAGKAERRGLATKVEVTTAGSTWTSTGAYDADGSMTVQKLPGGITQYNDLDNAGEPVGLRYTGQVTTTNEDGSTTVDPNGGWLSWSIDNDVTGRVAREWTPDGAAFTGPTADAPGDAVPYDRAYSYDNAGRLVTVKDRTASATGVDITDPTAATCVTRTYGFDRNDNRLTKATATSGTDGACTTTGAATIARAFDTADRPVTGANGVGNYVYDALGRTTTLPASDAPKPTDGDISLGYYDNDLARIITQADTTTAFTLDALDRRSVQTVSTSSTSVQVVRHYSDTSDNPTWVTDGTTTQRYTELVGADLALTVDQAGHGDLTIANNHGDTVTTVSLTPNTPATAIASWNGYDEYGQPNSTNSTSTGVLNYGWLGSKQRATTDSGLILMGSRLYNQATGLFTTVDPVDGGGANAYAYPTDPINQSDVTGQSWWRKALKGAAIVGGIAGAIACGASVVCGIAVGAAAAAGAYAASRAGTKSWSWSGFGRATAFGALSGAAWGGAARKAAWRFQGGSRLTRGWGVRFSKGGARGTDFLRHGSRRFGLHSHRIKGYSRWKIVHWHRRAKGGIARHRPWQQSKTDRRWRDRL
ncbi:RHS repeat-associated protein [Kribbella sp. VKM Ac-2527]|uniref:RHS repeat-associated protein n=1 Tax=Kribbella caucasensis TaxID=2512215 RepID=A0A4R6KGC4_9ACTN|nr:RHS repeat-associated core domain-containing protein [Kribbella sp. VKM Ac-2527]TDO48499.1 RHS repeat-associated protein [Kribbella sp. VKM Ac-2527]